MMPFNPRDPRQSRFSNPGQKWLDQLQSGARLTASMPLLEATGAFTDRIGAPGRRGNLGGSRPPTASQRIPAVRSAIASLRSSDSADVPTLAKLALGQIPGGEAALGGMQMPGQGVTLQEPANLDKSDVSDGGGGIGGYLRRPGVGGAMTAAGAAWMEAAGKPGATFGGSLGTGLKGFVAERARFGESELKRKQTAQEGQVTPQELSARQNTVTAILGQRQIPQDQWPQYLARVVTQKGYEGVLEELEVPGVDTADQTAPTRNTAEYVRLRNAVTDLEGQGVASGDPLLVAARDELRAFSLSAGIEQHPTATRVQTDYRFRLDNLAIEAGFPGGTEQMMRDNPGKFTELSREAQGQRQGDVYGKEWMSPTQLANDTALETLNRAYYIGGGRAQQMQNMATFDEVVSLIQGQINRDRQSGVDVDSEEYLKDSSRQGNSLMGWVVGNMPFAASMLNPEDANALDLVRAVVFQSLKETLGGQFAEREGERLVAAAYNPMLSPEVNMRRIVRLRNTMVQSERWYEALRAYKAEHGHLADFDYGSAIEYYVDNPLTLGAHLQVSDYEGVTDIASAVTSDIERIVKAERDFGNNPTESLSQVRARLFARFDPERVALEGPALLGTVERQIYDSVESYLQRLRR